MTWRGQRTRGFTVVELLIVIVVIGILASITVVGYSGVQRSARDTKRVSDLSKIAEAVGLYGIKYGNDIVAGSGCGGGGSGSGWFNYQGGTGGYTKSILQCLSDAGYLDTTGFIDPSGCTTTTGESSPHPAGSCKMPGYAYMKYTSSDGKTTCVYARLESGGDATKLTDASSPCSVASSNSAATAYGMNYQIKVTR